MARGVVFELERFGWAPGAPLLEVAGRWRGPRPRRLGAATLVVHGQGQDRRRLTPSTATGDARVHPEPELWRAEFLWTGTAEVEGAELEVGPSLVIELPAPDGAPVNGSRASVAAPPAAAVRDARQLELEGLRRQAQADRAEADRLREVVAPLRRDAEELPDVRAELETARADVRRLEGNAGKFDASLAAARKDADAREQRATAAGDRRVEALERESGGRASAAEERAERAERERDDVRAEHERLERALALAHEDAERLARERDGATADAVRLESELDATRGRAPTTAPEVEPTVTREEPVVSRPEPEPTETLEEPAAYAAPAEPEADPDPTVPFASASPAKPRSRQGRPPLQPQNRTPPTPRPLPRTQWAPRGLRRSSPVNSVALRAIAGAFVLLLAIVLLIVLLTVA